MHRFMSDEQDAYNAIKQRKDKFGTFHKMCLHVHTPESHDYQLIKCWDKNKFKTATLDREIYELCLERKVFPSVLTIDFFEPSMELFCDYKDRLDVLSFLLLAEELIANNIEIVVVADHHTITGVRKLEKAIEYLYQLKKGKTYPKVILGLEISCADKTHVVGIFDNTFFNEVAINNWLQEHLLNLEDGSFETSMHVLQFINSIGGIGYIAHLDESDIFKEEKYLNLEDTSSQKSHPMGKPI